MELKYSALSPYVRKVTITLHELGIAERVRLTKVDARGDPGAITPFNPLGKIPALVIDEDRVIFDSPVICEYLDAEFGGHRLLAASGPQRWETLTRAALADGMIDAAILVRRERDRDEAKRLQEWIAWQLRKVTQGLEAMEARIDTLGDRFDLGQIALAAALGYMPLRIDEVAGLARWPRLKAWYDKACERDSLRRTAPVL